MNLHLLNFFQLVNKEVENTEQVTRSHQLRKNKQILITNLKHIVVLLALIWQAHLSSAQDTIPLNSTHSFTATFQPGYTYSWWYTNQSGVRIDFASKSNKTEEILWNTEGDYTLFSQAQDTNNCLSEVITKDFVVYHEEAPSPFPVYSGPDTVIGSCQPYVFANIIPNDNSYTYLWNPSTNLDNPRVSNPIFTPGGTTMYVLSVTNLQGKTVTDTVTITVSEIFANAGDDIYMEQNSTVILDGSGSLGEELQFNWTTINGNIDNGANTANPVVSGFVSYYLEITDKFGCIATDSVSVFRIAHAPVASDDYDTTRYLTEVKIPVLDNDTDQENSIVPSSLTISLSPVNGTAYVDFYDYSIHYRPNESFSGTDHFEYQICNSFNECDRANVYVLVTDFKFLIPNAFSPNGDGINDYFEIKGIEYYEGNSIIIVNRWGNKVYEAKDYGINTIPIFWDGKANNGVRIGSEELPTGTYYYILDLGNGEASIGGSIYLDR